MSRYRAGIGAALATLVSALCSGAQMAEYKPLPDVESTPPRSYGALPIAIDDDGFPRGSDAHPDTPYEASDEFMEYLKAVEGSKVDPNTLKHVPYQDSQGKWTVGIGHLIGDGKSGPGRFEGGITDDEAKAIFRKDIIKHRNRVREFVGDKKFDGLDKHRQEMLTDIAYNGGIQKFPRFTQAVLDGRMDVAALEHHRAEKSEDGYVPLPSRNEAFAKFMGVDYIPRNIARKTLRLMERARASDSQNNEYGAYDK